MTNDFPLSRHDALLLLEVCAEFLTCDGEAAFRATVERTAQLIGFERAVCVCADMESVLSEGDSIQHFISLDYPTEYLETYTCRGLHRQDRVLRAFLETGRPQGFTQIASRHAGLGPDPVRQLDLDHGLRRGYLSGICNGGSPHGCFFFVAGDHMENPARTERVLELVTPHLAEALKRTLGTAVSRLRFPLTPREIEVLEWLKIGKSSWEISVILKRGENVVNFHVKNVMRKLEAANRTHAVAIALHHGLIKL